MQQLTTVIVDDEARSRSTIKDMLSLYCPELKVVGEASNVSEAVHLIRSVCPDVVLLDIKMPDGTGFDVLEQLESKDFALVFITAFDEYAIKAFKFNAIDYLLKPIDPDELVQTVERIKTQKRTLQTDLSMVLNNLKDLKKENKKLVLKTAESIFVVNVSDIIRCEASGNYTTFYVHGQHSILVSRTLKDYEELLLDYAFIRIHQSHLVNLDHVLRYDKSDGGTLVMTDDLSVPVATRKREKLLHALGLM